MTAPTPPAAPANVPTSENAAPAQLVVVHIGAPAPELIADSVVALLAAAAEALEDAA